MKKFEVRWVTKNRIGSALAEAENQTAALMEVLKKLSPDGAKVVDCRITIKPVEVAPVRWNKVEGIKKQFKNGTYNWDKAIKGTVEKIITHPETLLLEITGRNRNGGLLQPNV